MPERTIKVTNKLNILKEAIIAETPSTGQTRIEWNESPPAYEYITFPDTETLTLTIENGAGAEFDLFGYAELPAWAEFEFSGNHSCPGGTNPQITVIGDN